MKEISIKYSKIFLSLLLFVFVSYVITNLTKSQDLLNIAQFMLLILGIFFLIFMNFPQYKKMHYESISFILGFCVLMKIVFDWVFTNYNKALSGIIVPLISSLTIHLKCNLIHIIIYNILFFISFSLRYFIS